MIFITGGAYSGKTEYARKNYTDKQIINVNTIVRETAKNGADCKKEIMRLAEENADAIFISDEVGCGIVPADKKERDLREIVGRVNCFLAKKSDTVVRVVCGIGMVLK